MTAADPALPLQGRVCLVTGAGGGIGHALCNALTVAGARVVATDVARLSDDYAVDVSYRHDVTQAGDWNEIIESVRKRYGRLDALVNNAAVSLVRRITDTSVEQWRRVMSVNVEGILLGLRASVPLLAESGREQRGGSSVVNVSSVAGLRGVAFNAAYCASKAAVTLLSKTAAIEFANLGYPIRVNSIHPGGVDTPMMDGILSSYVEMGLAESVEQQKKDFTSRIPLRRWARPQDIGGGVVFLCSSASGFMTGAELVIDGGVTA